MRPEEPGGVRGEGHPPAPAEVDHDRRHQSSPEPGVGRGVLEQRRPPVVADEVELKQRARDLGLLMMGPDAGTAMLGGVGLGFANVVEPGPVGVVAAAGTGAQEVMTLLHRWGAGPSHVIGVGGRDTSAAVDVFAARMASRSEMPSPPLPRFTAPAARVPAATGSRPSQPNPTARHRPPPAPTVQRAWRPPPLRRTSPRPAPGTSRVTAACAVAMQAAMPTPS